MEIKTAKIVGGANATTWSQVHIFFPQDGKKQSHGDLVAALSFKAKAEEIEVSSFGAEIITRLQEIYYSNQSESVLKKLNQSLESLSAEFLDRVELEAVLGVVLKKAKTYLYIARNGQGQAGLQRAGSLVELFKEKTEAVEVKCGELKPGDRLVLGTAAFFQLVSWSELKPALAAETVVSTGEILGALVHGKEANSQAAAVIVGAEEEETQLLTEEPTKEKTKKNWLRLKQAGQKGLNLVREKLSQRRPRVWLGRESRGKRSALSAALILFLVFGISLVLAGRKKQNERRAQTYQAVLEEAQYKYDEAHNLLKLNPLRAKSLLTDSQTRIEEYEASAKKGISEELKTLKEKIAADLSLVQREYQLETANEWFDFDLVKDGFRASDWEAEENLVWAVDEAGKTVVELDLASKASRVVSTLEKSAPASLVGLVGERGFVASNSLITVIEAEDGQVVAEVGEEKVAQLADCQGFGSNLYLLDRSSSGQIYKYLGVASGLSSSHNYLKGESLDLSEAVSLAIDGAVWVLFSDGTVAKYIQGAKEPFNVAGLDRSLEEPIKIFTSPEEANLYILDRKQTRVVVLDKSGEYQAQYIWPGLAGIKDLIVNEGLGKMFLLTGEKVFTIDLKE